MNKPRLGLWRRVVVHGDSMRPTLHPGDRLLVVAWPRPRVGRLVAVRTPDRVVVKRVVRRNPDGTVDVAGDNPAASTDYGGVAPHDVLGVAVYRYAPEGRVGRLH